MIALDRIDKEVNTSLTKVFKSKLYTNILSDLKRSLYQHKSIHLLGVGALGRLAIAIEASYKKFWLNLINVIPDRMDEFVANHHVLSSLSIGGDLTLVNTQIDFKDLYMIANRQVEKTVSDGDICIVLAGDGTSRAINQAAISASKIGATVYYLYDATKEDLANIDIAKGIITNKAIIKICLANDKKVDCYNLKEQILVYALLEEANTEWLKENLVDKEYQVIKDKNYLALSASDYVKAIGNIAKALNKDKTIANLNKLAKLQDENIIYMSHNYLVDLISILVDKQLKQGLQPFKKRFDKDENQPFDLVLDPLYPTLVSYQHIFRRSIKGLDESKNTYKLLGLNNPKISSFHSSELSEYLIGSEMGEANFNYKLAFIDVNEEYEVGELEFFDKQNKKYRDSVIVRIGNLSRVKLGNNELAISAKIPASCLDFYAHLLLKLLFI